MSLSRFKEREIIRNNDDDYKIIFQSRIPYNGLRQYSYEELKYPTDAELAVIQKTQKVWGYGSRLYKLSNEFYGDPSYWWVIAWFNKIPSEFSLRAGDTIFVPTPLSYVLTTFGL
jgi:hypothetical protein